MSTPSHDLAKIIIEKLLAENLIVTADQTKLHSQLAEGKLRAEDWRLALEKASDKEVQA